MKTYFFIALGLVCFDLCAQQRLQGSVYDGETREPLVGANVLACGTSHGAVTNINGQFLLSLPEPADSIEISFVGYEKQRIACTSTGLSIALAPALGNLQALIVTANREAVLRSDAPVAISKLSSQVINDTKPVLITELVNKVPGVVMLNYNNEQHAMAIRQPMGTSAYFLYLEDGLPMRPMGVFNHNALIEMNVFSISNMEVVRGPVSSLYGPEAVGGAINFITHRATVVPTAKIGLQGDQWGYKRIQYAGGGMIGKNLGVYISGFEARQRDAWQQFSDYDKSSVSVRLDYMLSEKTSLTATFSGNEYLSDMAGSVDSVSFYNRSYTSTTDFTYRKVHSIRSRLSVSHQWNKTNETSLTVAYRDNYIEQVPNYGIRWTSGSSGANVERNRNSFYSKVAQLQHNTRFRFLDASLITGGMIDLSPVDYWAYRIDLAAQLRDDHRSVEKFTIVEERPDIFLSNYDATLKNFAAFSQFQISPMDRLKVTLGMRYDKMGFDYKNHLDESSGSRSFQQLTPKVGVTFDLLNDKGVYANYSEGFSPPGLTSIFRKRPNATPGNEFYYNLKPAKFNNMELGGWAAFFQNKIYADVAIYQMTGRNELLSVRQPDNSTEHQSAGKTHHRGIEYGVTYNPTATWSFRFGGTNASHRFEEFELSTRSNDDVKNVNGKDMPQSPSWIANSEITFKPSFAKGLRLSVEWQRISSWYEDQVNRKKYDDKGFLGMRGVSYLNLRAGYDWKGFAVFTNILNLTDELYAHSATRGNAFSDRTTYTPAAPRTFVMGMQYTITHSKSKP